MGPEKKSLVLTLSFLPLPALQWYNQNLNIPTWAELPRYHCKYADSYQQKVWTLCFAERLLFFSASLLVLMV